MIQNKEEFLKCCAYYKGEEFCPFKSSSLSFLFWHYEKTFSGLFLSRFMYEDVFEFLGDYYINNKEGVKLALNDFVAAEDARLSVNSGSPGDIAAKYNNK